jgi:toxin ParE1/3/4
VGDVVSERGDNYMNGWSDLTGCFGPRRARIHRDTLVRAMGELANGPDVAGSKAREEIMPGFRTLHVVGNGRRGRHFL